MTPLGEKNLLIDILLILLFFGFIIVIIAMGDVLIKKLVNSGKSFYQIKNLVWNYFVLSILFLVAIFLFIFIR